MKFTLTLITAIALTSMLTACSDSEQDRLRKQQQQLAQQQQQLTMQQQQLAQQQMAQQQYQQPGYEHQYQQPQYQQPIQQQFGQGYGSPFGGMGGSYGYQQQPQYGYGGMGTQFMGGGFGPRGFGGMYGPRGGFGGFDPRYMDVKPRPAFDQPQPAVQAQPGQTELSGGWAICRK